MRAVRHATTAAGLLASAAERSVTDEEDRAEAQALTLRAIGHALLAIAETRINRYQSDSPNRSNA